MTDKFYKDEQNIIYRNPIVANRAGLTEITQEEKDAQLAINNAPPAPTNEEVRKSSLMSGIEFEGVMCSAHKEDQWGLDSIKGYVAGGMDIDFQFKNGNVLTLTSENIAAFEAVWFPFRVAHTKVNFQP
jgi:hypothetical protein